MSAALTDFASLLSFRGNNGWDIGCAFVAAWGGMTSQVVGLICVGMLSLKLRRDGARQWEVVTIWLVMLIALALVFASNALGAGKTSFVTSLMVYVCRKGRNLPLSLTSALVQLSLSLYLTIRLITIRLPFTPRTRDVTTVLREPSVLRAGSVVVFNVLILLSAVLHLNLLGQFIPFCVGGLLVLAVFNHSFSNERAVVLPTTSTIFTVPFPAPIPSSLEAMYPQSSRMEDDISDTEPLDSPSRPALRISVMSDQSFDSAMVQDVEEAIIATAVRHAAMSSQLSLAVPHSAPPQMEAIFAKPPPRSNSDGPASPTSKVRHGHILPSQVEFAERLELELAARTPVGGPVVRPPGRDRKLRVVVYDDSFDESENVDATSPGSILGSDIIHRSPVQSHPPAIGDTSTPRNERPSTFGALAVEIPEQHSYLANQDEFTGPQSERQSFSIVSHRTNSISSLQSSRRWTRHFSITSHRKRSDELAAVPEQGNVASPSTPSKGSVRRARRTTFGRPISSSSRRTFRIHTPVEGPAPPMPTRPPIHLSVPIRTRPSLELPSISPLDISPLKMHKSSPSPLRPTPPSFPADTYFPPLPSGPIPTSSSVLLGSQPNWSSTPSSNRIRPLPVAPVPANVPGSAASEERSP
ncbi:hypothetical protein EIP91_006696 [Steccherinum ochraceum]|uniref:Uncharacterized protein n=1 Tax=Steccherinum ochraceum TaxID=92696 RepID=A0A4R0RV50_9APHY|nr:hypothetical protein EIP91_006696 [Steccherinum ochraceum]